MSFDASLSGTNIFLDTSQDGNLILAAKYTAKESVGVSILVATSCLSLVAVLGLLVLMGVRTFFLTRLGVGPHERAWLHHRLLLGPIGLLRTRTISSEPMLPHTLSFSWSPISSRARVLFDRILGCP